MYASESGGGGMDFHNFSVLPAAAVQQYIVGAHAYIKYYVYTPRGYYYYRKWVVVFS